LPGHEAGAEPTEWVSPWGEDTSAFYAAHGLAARCGYGIRPAVVVVDMSRAFCDPSNPLGSDMTETLERIADLLEAARLRGTPIIYTTIAYAADHGDLGVWGLKVPALRSLQLGDIATDIHPPIKPLPQYHVIVKKFPSSFFVTNLLSLLNNARIDTVVLVGCTMSGCVRATAIDSISHGFRTVIPAECVGDQAPGPHAANLFDLNAKYADVVSIDEMLDYLQALDRRL
jgi:maleamate amidohydrolase